MSPILFSLGVLAAIGAIVYLVSLVEKKRTARMAAASQAMGFAFEETGNLDALLAFGDLPLFRRGRSNKARNVMTGRTADRQVKVFDYEYAEGSGKNKHTHRQTVALFPGGAAGVPDLVLAPESVFHKIGQVLGYQDIDFEFSPEFSSRYLLRGDDEPAIRAAFTADTLAFFAQQPGWHVEVRGRNAGVYRSGKRCKPEETPSLLAEALRVLRALTHA